MIDIDLMPINSLAVYKHLKASGVKYIYHANSVLTSCQFLRANALLSRGTVEELGYPQTEQKSDESDKQFSLWFDVFTDSVDIHARANKKNDYGPVLFAFDIEIIREVYTGQVWVTRSNPWYWKGKTKEARWFEDKESLLRDFEVGTFEQMLVFRHCGGRLPFGSYLKKIILDDP